MKLLSSLLALFMISAALLAGPAEDMLASAELTVEGLVNMAKRADNTPAAKEGQKPTLDPVAYEALVLAFKDAECSADNFYKLSSKSVASEAMREVTKLYQLPSSAPFIGRLLDNPAVPIRVRAVTMLSGGLFGNSGASRQKIVSLMEKETEAPVIAAIVYTFANDGGKEPAIGQYLVKCLDSADPVIRRTVVCYSCSSWNFKTEGLAEKMADMLLTEEDPKVLDALFNYSGNLGKDVICDSFAKLYEGKWMKEKADDEDEEKAAERMKEEQAKLAAIQPKVLKGLIKMWWNFPLYNTHCEKAYEKTLEYIGQIPRDASSKKLLAGLNELGQKSSVKRTVDDYLKNAPWYEPETVRQALEPLVAIKGLDAFQRAKFIKALFAHGAAKEDLETMVEKLITEEELREFDANQLRKAVSELK